MDKHSNCALPRGVLPEYGSIPGPRANDEHLDSVGSSAIVCKKYNPSENEDLPEKGTVHLGDYDAPNIDERRRLRRHRGVTLNVEPIRNDPANQEGKQSVVARGGVRHIIGTDPTLGLTSMACAPRSDTPSACPSNREVGVIKGGHKCGVVGLDSRREPGVIPGDRRSGDRFCVDGGSRVGSTLEQQQVDILRCPHVRNWYEESLQHPAQFLDLQDEHISATGIPWPYKIFSSIHGAHRGITKMLNEIGLDNVRDAMPLATTYGFMRIHVCPWTYGNDFPPEHFVKVGRNVVVILQTGLVYCPCCPGVYYNPLPLRFNVETVRGQGFVIKEKEQDHEIWKIPTTDIVLVTLSPEYSPAPHTVVPGFSCTPVLRGSFNHVYLPISMCCKHDLLFAHEVDTGRIPLSPLTWIFRFGLPSAVVIDGDLFYACGWESVLYAASICSREGINASMYTKYGYRTFTKLLELTQKQSTLDRLVDSIASSIRVGHPVFGSPRFIELARSRLVGIESPKPPEKTNQLVDLTMKWIGKNGWSVIMRSSHSRTLERFVHGLTHCAPLKGDLRRRVQIVWKYWTSMESTDRGFIRPGVNIMSFRAVFEIARILKTQLSRPLRRLWSRVVAECTYWHFANMHGETSSSDISWLNRLRFGSEYYCSPNHSGGLSTSGSADVYKMFGNLKSRKIDAQGTSGGGGPTENHHFDILPSTLRRIIMDVLREGRPAFIALFGRVSSFVVSGAAPGAGSNTLSNLVCACTRSCPCNRCCPGRRLAAALLDSALDSRVGIDRLSTLLSACGVRIGGQFDRHSSVFEGCTLGTMNLDQLLTEEYRYVTLGNHTMHCINGNVLDCAMMYYLYLALLGLCLDKVTLPSGSKLEQVAFTNLPTQTESYIRFYDRETNTTISIPFWLSGNNTLVIKMSETYLPKYNELVSGVWSDFSLKVVIVPLPCQPSSTKELVLYNGFPVRQLFKTAMDGLSSVSLISGHPVRSVEFAEAAISFFSPIGVSDMRIVSAQRPVTAYFQSFSWMYRLTSGTHMLDSTVREFIEALNTHATSEFAKACSRYVSEEFVCKIIEKGKYHIGMSRLRRHAAAHATCSHVAPSCTAPDTSDFSSLSAMTFANDIYVSDLLTVMAANDSSVIEHNKRLFESTADVMTPDMLRYKHGIVHMIRHSNVFDRRHTKFWFVHETINANITDQAIISLFSGENDVFPDLFANFTIPQIAAVIVNSRLGPRLARPTLDGRAMLVSDVPEHFYSSDAHNASNVGVAASPFPSHLTLISVPSRSVLAGSAVYRRWFSALYQGVRFRVPVVIVVPSVQDFIEWFSRRPHSVALRSMFDPYSWYRVSAPLVVDDVVYAVIGTVSAVYALDEAGWSATDTPYALKFDSFESYRNTIKGTYVTFHPTISSARYEEFLSSLPAAVKYYMYEI